jgi:hypothetical protein
MLRRRHCVRALLALAFVSTFACSALGQEQSDAEEEKTEELAKAARTQSPI